MQNHQQLKLFASSLRSRLLLSCLQVGGMDYHHLRDQRSQTQAESLIHSVRSHPSPSHLAGLDGRLLCRRQVSTIGWQNGLCHLELLHHLSAA